MNIPVILGTGRVGRQSEKVARFVHQQVQAAGVESAYIDIANWATPVTIPEWENDNALVIKWKALVAAADGLIVVTPEYNHSYPGELKILLDKASAEYAGKPVGLVCVSEGGLGGARVMESLLPVWQTLGLIPVKGQVYVSDVKNLFNEDGSMHTDQHDTYARRVSGLIESIKNFLL